VTTLLNLVIAEPTATRLMFERAPSATLPDMPQLSCAVCATVQDVRCAVPVVDLVDMIPYNICLIHICITL